MKQVWFSFVPVLISSLLDYGCTSPSCNMTCHKDARCEVQGGTTGCYCSQGYTGNGITVCKGKDILPGRFLSCAHLKNLPKSPLAQGLNFMSQHCHPLACFQSPKNFNIFWEIVQVELRLMFWYNLPCVSVEYDWFSSFPFPSELLTNLCWFTFSNFPCDSGFLKLGLGVVATAQPSASCLTHSALGHSSQQLITTK